MNILERSSMILLELCKGKEYKRAKEEYLRITHSCLDEEKSISNYFERELEERKGEIEIETYRILKENVKEIILNYKSCLEEEKGVKEVIGKEYEKEIECAICLGSHKRSEVYIIEGCNHEFGKECIKEWKKVRRECPLCRKEIESMIEYREKKEWIKKVIGFLSIKIK